MTFVFAEETNGSIYTACGDDFYDIAEDLELPAGTYMVYFTQLLPDEINKIGTKYLKYLNYITRYVREPRVPE